MIEYFHSCWFDVKVEIRDLLSSLKNLNKLSKLASPIIVGAAVGSAALGARYLMRAWEAFKARPVVPRARKFYPGGFEQVMTRREAALILGVREHTVVEKIREAHRRVMVANHPDAGGSHYLASKINEAKDVLLKKGRSPDSAF
ncbi:UNVERIFIED_CONTAM: Mitochondrial import inner membrane translocase subunit TIM14-3 [Sesamum radiatum]|uniref:Mitochondrial import inner membrane translocase subunit TIM14-3 n=1 Tax=Sesamum radiatum TaxID=300843 RepID=A0AAW2WIH2_SESRA